VRSRNHVVLPRHLPDLNVNADFYNQGVAVNAIRFRIGWIMVFVALAALDFTAIRAVFDHRGPTSYLLGLGAMPLANILVVGLIVGYWRRRRRRFLMGFEVFGSMALAAYAVSASLFAKELVIPYIRLLHTPFIINVENSIRMSHESYFLIYYLILAVELGLPLFAFALIGGFLCRKLATGGNGDQIMPHR
jgi:hypothetical protein